MRNTTSFFLPSFVLSNMEKNTTVYWQLETYVCIAKVFHVAYKKDHSAADIALSSTQRSIYYTTIFVCALISFQVATNHLHAF
mmetsp:Transcript_61908/g.182875  ORF Transcript_61908/g.182875 Transcript_61908/m.182875 type:complete len:83 (-) Transcript_61908:143-391(-)